MAKIKFGMMMTDARNKLGGQVFSKNAAGAYVRTKVVPTNPQTIFQAAARLLFASISIAWSTLSDTVRTAWNAAVPDWSRTDVFGDLKNPTGKALFQRLNNQAQSAGLPAVVVVPAKLEMPDDLVTGVAFVTGVGTLTVTGANADASTQIMLFGTPQMTAGTNFVKNKLRNFINFAGDVDIASDDYNAYIARFGIPADGANIRIGIKYVLASGQASPTQIIKATVVTV